MTAGTAVMHICVVFAVKVIFTGNLDVEGEGMSILRKTDESRKPATAGSYPQSDLH